MGVKRTGTADEAATALATGKLDISEQMISKISWLNVK
jgi:hypothetical protein